MDGLKWEEYLRDINQILEISNDINDGWEIIQQVNIRFVLKLSSIEFK